MKLNPQSLRFGDFEFRQLVEQSIKDCVLTYNPPKFIVREVSFDAQNDEWEILLDEPPPDVAITVTP